MAPVMAIKELAASKTSSLESEKFIRCATQHHSTATGSFQKRPKNLDTFRGRFQKSYQIKL
jgi:hypothetical protein